MQLPTSSIETVARAIELAVAPVFLLTGIAGLLNVMTGRLSRIIDRGRFVAAAHPEGEVPELKVLERRRHFVSVAITSCTISALLVCMVIANLFLDVVMDVPFEHTIAPIFTAAVLALVVGLSYFLREVHIAMMSIHLEQAKRD